MKDFFEEEIVVKKKLHVKKVVIASIIAVTILALIITIIVYKVNPNFQEWVDVNILRKEIQQDDVASIEINSEANAEICAYDKYIGILSKNVFQIYNNSGKEEATLDIPVNNVIFNSCNKFLGIAENGGKKIYLISDKNLAWENEVEGSITQICVNRNGYVAVVISDTSYKTVVSLYDNTGKELFKIFLSSTRIADVTISNDNKYLALAEIDTSSSVIQSKVKVISIENAKTKTGESVIYIHEAEANKLLSNISYKDKNRLICMYDDSIEVIYNEEITTLINLEERDASFMTIDLNNTVAVVEEKASGLFTADSEVSLIDVTNKRENQYTVEEVAKEIYANGNNIALNVGSELHFINTGGWLVKRYLSNQEITNVVLSENLAGIIYRDKIDIISL